LARQATNIILAGVGGQGVVTAGVLMGRAATRVGFNAVMSEIHGMSQRGGVVTVDLRLGDVYGPIIPEGEADLLLGFEQAETLRAARRAGRETVVIMSTERIVPPGVTIGDAKYPDIQHACDELRAQGVKVLEVDARGTAEKVKNAHSGNLVLVGAAYASGALPVSYDSLEEAVRGMFPQKSWESNLEAMRQGANCLGSPGSELVGKTRHEADP
jgi:indolepyruvate ferredoxin oxidoreductase beta subunit